MANCLNIVKVVYFLIIKSIRRSLKYCSAED